MADMIAKNEELAAVIMAGGAGTRFWPVSTEDRPKQFLNLFGERTLIQESYDRVKDIIPPERILVLTSERFVPKVLEQLPEIPRENIIGEPFRRDTAAACALAASVCEHLFGKCTIAMLTADHKIYPYDAFRETLLSAAKEASKSEALYTLGIMPRYPATGYGYLHCGEQLMTGAGPKHFRLLEFKEKPDIDTAERFLREGGYFWNSGMFVWHVDSIKAEFRAHLPGHLEAMEKAAKSFGTNNWHKALQEAFEPLPKISIDFGIMEYAADVRMTAAEFSWFDVGGWLALEPFMEKDKSGNSFKGETITKNSYGNIVFNDANDEIIALVGISNACVIRAGNKTLVVSKDKLEDVKKLVSWLDEKWH